MAKSSNLQNFQTHRSRTICTRLTREEFDEFRAAAIRSQTPVGVFVRGAALAAARRISNGSGRPTNPDDIPDMRALGKLIDALNRAAAGLRDIKCDYQTIRKPESNAVLAAVDSILSLTPEVYRLLGLEAPKRPTASRPTDGTGRRK